MQACALILLPSSIFPSLFLSICFCLFPTILNHPGDKYMNGRREYTARIRWWYQYFSYNKRSFIGPNCEGYPIKMCIVMTDWISLSLSR